MAVDFEMYSGDSKTISIPIVDEDGAALDVSTAAAIAFTIVHYYTYAVKCAKSLGDGITVDGATVTVTLDPEDTDDLAGRYRHELQVTDIDNNVFTALQGKATILRDYQ